MADIECAIEAKFVDDLAKALYWTGRIPDKITFSKLLSDSHAVLYFEEPSGSLAMLDGGVIQAGIAVPLFITGPDINGVADGWLYLRCPLAFTMIGDGDQARQNLTLDIAGALAVQPNDVIEVVLLDQPYIYDQASYRSAIRTGVNVSLQDMAPINIPLTTDKLPHLSAGGILCQSSIGLHPELNLFANVDGGPVQGIGCAFGSAFEGKPKKNVFFPPRASMLVTAPFLLTRINQVLADRGVGASKVLLDNINKKILSLDTGIGGDVTIDTGVDNPFIPATITLPFTLDFSPEVKSITLESDLDIRFMAGALRVSGRLTADISWIPDPDVDFTIGIALEMTPAGGFAPRIQFAKADYDADFITVISTILLGPIGLILANTLDQLVDAETTKELGAQARIGLNDPQVVSLIRSANLLPAHFEITGDEDPARQITLSVQASGISIYDLGVRIESQLNLAYVRRSIQYAPYCRGNTQTYELHSPGCPFGDRMSSKHVQLFYVFQDAIDLGYDPCRECMGGAEDGLGSLRVRLTYDCKADRKTAPIKVTAERLSGPDSKYLTSFSLEQYLENPGGRLFDFKPMANGLWRFTLTDGTWQAEPIEQQLANYGQWIQLTITRPL